MSMAEVNLSKVPKVNLSKNQVVCLTKDGNEKSQTLEKVFFGANWGSIVRKSVKGFFSRIFGSFNDEDDVIDVDLDASVILYNSSYKVIDIVYYGHKVSKCGGIRHSGDDLTGDKYGDDGLDNETISVVLSKINSEAKYLVFILNSYRHQKFDEIPYAGLRIYTGMEGNPDEILASFNLKNSSEFNGKEAIVLGAVYKDCDKIWKFKSCGQVTNEKSISEMSNGSALNFVKGI